MLIAVAKNMDQAPTDDISAFYSWKSSIEINDVPKVYSHFIIGTSITPLLVSQAQLEVCQPSQQSVTTARWDSNKTPLHLTIKLSCLI